MEAVELAEIDVMISVNVRAQLGRKCRRLVGEGENKK